MRFVFRADGSGTIGFGHLSRAVALASAALRAGADAIIVAARPNTAVEAFVQRAGIDLRAIDSDPASSADALATRTIAGPASHVVVDGYVFGSGYLDQLGGERRVITYVDDLAVDPPRCDVLLNQNVSASPSAYRASRAELLLGPSFAVVNDRFVAARASRAPRGGMQHLLVTMGGSDPVGATLTAIRALDHFDLPRRSVRVVVGSMNTRREQIVQAAADCARHDVEVRVDADMAAEMAWSDLAITASGVTAAELACVGVPGVTFAIVDNQVPIAEALSRLGMFEVLPFGGGAPELIGGALSRLVAEPARLSGMVAVQRQTIDGQGKARVIERLLAIGERAGHTLGGSGGSIGRD
jgi:UDP-2,4-diacetamido-2,4,6-trideoxy-beta-L-altropyranose hydrolase